MRSGNDGPADGGAIGAQLRRLSERIDGDATRVYAALGVRFEQRWFGVLDQLATGEPATVGELATRLGITHVSVSQTRTSLERQGLVESGADPKDGRRTRLSLTLRGEALIEQLAPVWQALEAAAIDLDAESGEVSLALRRLEAALASRSLFDRTMDRLKP